jgi:HK97 family phage major capsid protein
LTDTTGQPLRLSDMLTDLRLISTPAITDNLATSTANNTSEIYVGDFTKLVFMMREQMSIQVVKVLFATTGEIAFVCHVRGDVAVLYPSAFAIVTGVKP